MNGPTDVRKGQWHGWLSREQFRERFRRRFHDPAFEPESDAIRRLEALAWDAYKASRKSPRSAPAGPDFADPSFPLSVEWLETHTRIARAAADFADPELRSRVLVICGSPRSDGTCPSEVSKSYRLARAIERRLHDDPGVEVDFLDLSELTSEPGRTIHPCKACVSTAMPLCHWPCSCYPNHALGQSPDWMGEIYERWTRAHAIAIVVPVHWQQVPSVFKLMMDRLVCADGGNPDPTTTAGKDPEKAKALELAGWGYPKHLAGRAFAVVAHGDADGAGSVRRALEDWLTDMGLVAAGRHATLERYIGYLQPYASSHDALDGDIAVIAEVENVARALLHALPRVRDGSILPADEELATRRPK